MMAAAVQHLMQVERREKILLSHWGIIEIQPSNSKWAKTDNLTFLHENVNEQLQLLQKISWQQANMHS